MAGKVAKTNESRYSGAESKRKKDGEHTPIGSCEVLHVICMKM